VSDELGAKQTVELIGALRDTLTSFASRERTLQRSLDHLTGGHDALHAAAVEEENRRFEEAGAAERAALQERLQQLSRWDTRRRARLKAAIGTARIKRLDLIEAEKGREISAVQHGRLSVEREKAAALQENDAHLSGLAANLENARQALLQLQRQTRAAFGGYGSFRRLMTETPTDPGHGEEPQALIEEFNSLYPSTLAELDRFRKLPAPAFFRVLPLWLIVLLLAGLAAVQFFPPLQFLPPHPAAAGATVLALAAVAFYFLSARSAQPFAADLSRRLARLAGLYQACAAHAQGNHQAEAERIEAEAAARLRELDERWQRATQQAQTRREATVRELNGKPGPLTAKHEAFLKRRTAALEAESAAALAVLRRDHEQRLQSLEESRTGRLEKQLADNQTRWREAETSWTETVPPLFAKVASAIAVGETFPDWSPDHWQTWTPPDTLRSRVPFGRLEVDLASLCDSLPRSERMPLPGPATFSLPTLLEFPEAGSLLLETGRSCGESVAGALNALIVRLLAGSPPGRLNFTILDPVGLGQNFAGVMHLADYEDSLINKRIWTQTAEIEQRLSDLNKHIEKVIQLHLRNEYPTIREYNEQAGNIAEKYHFLVIADFPVNFSETALRHLVNIAVSGARCGVYLFIHWDRRHDVPRFVLDELRRNCVWLTASRAGFEMEGLPGRGTRLTLESAPPPEVMTPFLHRVGAGWKDSNRVEVPFARIAPAAEEMWSLDTAEELRVPIGRAGAAKLQYLAIGRGTRQHVLVGGKTGSGKSTLFHVMITNLALWCSPEQVEFYLVDFKKGVEFKAYATHKLPHARVVAIESDREFGLGVLQRVDEELRRRGDLFRKLGVQNLAAYRKASGQPLPRTLLLIDEFQEYFVEDDRIAQEANVLLDRVVRQGRAFGIHVILGSQTLGGAYTLARATMGQMVIRIALQCNEADAQLIMDDNNPAPRFLTRPGEGIYNDMAGAVEGNSPFQTVWLPEDDRDERLKQIRARAREASLPAGTPFVFEGNAPAHPEDNPALGALLRAPQIATVPRIWLGEPNAIKGPTEVSFPRQSGSHLLIVGQAEEPILALMTAGLLALSTQVPRDTRFLWFDSSAPDSPAHAWLRNLRNTVPQELTVVRPADLSDALTRLREKDADASAFLFIPALQNFKKLRQEEDFGFSLDEDAAASPAKIFSELLTEGPTRGLHVIAACDTYNNVMRFVGRKPLTEFERRVLFQMNANDSASLIDSPKAGSLGLHRALLYNGQEGTLEIFRPYALPETAWLEQIGAVAV
jgi:DNA segregation ATPase FtsK/SpoIIIE and related proteins